MAIYGEANSAAEKPARALLESYQAVVSATVAIQELHMKLAWGLLEHSRKQQEAFLTLAGESIRAYTSPLPSPRSEVRSGDGELPVEDYDRLSVEEVNRRLKELDAGEVEELKAYEKSNKNRPDLVERFDRSLV